MRNKSQRNNKLRKLTRVLRLTAYIIVIGHVTDICGRVIVRYARNKAACKLNNNWHVNLRRNKLQQEINRNLGLEFFL